LVSFLIARLTTVSVTPNLSAICRYENPCLRSTIALLASTGVAGRPAPILAPPCFVIRFSFKLEIDYTRIQDSLQQVVPVYLYQAARIAIADPRDSRPVPLWTDMWKSPASRNLLLAERRIQLSTARVVGQTLIVGLLGRFMQSLRNAAAPGVY